MKLSNAIENEIKCKINLNKIKKQHKKKIMWNNKKLINLNKHKINAIKQI